MQTSKGLSNFSSLKFGDSRIQRVSSAHREEYRSPVDIRAYGRNSEEPHIRPLPVLDPCFRNMASMGHQGAGLFAKTYAMADELLGDESGSVGQGSVARLPGGAGDDRGRSLRLSVYRTALSAVGAFDPAAPTNVPPAGAEALKVLDTMFKGQLVMRTGKGVGRFHLQSMFSYLDRSGRAGYDLEDFRQVLECVSLDLHEAQATALFATYDRGAKGFVSFADFRAQFDHDPHVDPAVLERLLTVHGRRAARQQHLHQSWSADLALGRSRIVRQVLAEEGRGKGGAGFAYSGDDFTVASKNAAFEAWLEALVSGR